MSDLGRRIPTDFEHITKYALRALFPSIPERVEDVLALPASRLRRIYDQGEATVITDR